MARGTLVIVNPRSRAGITGRRWREIEAPLRDGLGELQVETTRGPRDAERIAREAARAGIGRIVVAGGDGTFSEVAAGLLGHGLAGYVELGLLPLGTGCDLARGLGIPQDPARAIGILAGGHSRAIDAGRVSCRGERGEPRESFFVNVSSLGISALVNDLQQRRARVLGSTLSFLASTLRAISRYRPQAVTIRADGELVHEAPVVLAASANGRYFGGGMDLAPRAALADGLLDLVVVDGLPRRVLLQKLLKLYRGTHVDDPAVTWRRARVIEARAAAGDVRIEVDGEALGSLPARWESLPGALQVIGPPA